MEKKISPLDLSTALKHAHAMGAAGVVWVDYDPTQSLAFQRVEAALSRPAAPVIDAGVEDIARKLFDHDIQTGFQGEALWDWTWPEHKNDDGYRGDGGYVKIAPRDIQERYRDRAKIVCTNPPPSKQPATDAALAWDRLKLWFFRETTNEQRGKLFSLFGWPADQAKTHAIQERLLRRVIAALSAEKLDIDAIWKKTLGKDEAEFSAPYTRPKGDWWYLVHKIKNQRAQLKKLNEWHKFYSERYAEKLDAEALKRECYGDCPQACKASINRAIDHLRAAHPQLFKGE